MIEQGAAVRIGPTHRYHGAAGIVAEVASEHGNGDPRTNPYRIELTRPTASGVREIWLGAVDLEVVR